MTGRVAVLIPCRDEGAVLGRKIRNTLALRFPEGGPHALLVVDDHSLDGTLEAAFRAAGPGRPDVEVRYLRSRRPPGKTGALAEGIEATRGFDAVLVTDADVLLEPDALLRLLDRLDEPGVGLVSGEARYVRRIEGDAIEGDGETSYDRFSRWVRRRESLRGRVFSVHGECLALRPVDGLLPEPGIASDDLDLALAARRKGLAVVYADGARFYEARPECPRARAAQDLRRARSFVQFLARRGGSVFDRSLPAGDRLRRLAYLSAAGVPFLAAGAFVGAALLALGGGRVRLESPRPPPRVARLGTRPGARAAPRHPRPGGLRVRRRPPGERPLAPLPVTGGGRFFARGDLVVFALAFGLRILHVHFVEKADPWADAPIIDEAAYDRAAQRIASGEWIGKGVFFQDPLYPYALGALYALFGRSFLLVRVLQAALDAASAAVIGALARRLGGRMAGAVSGSLAALYAPFLYFAGQLDKATFAVAASAGFLAAWTRAREGGESRGRWFGAGVALGAACLLRGNFLAFLPVVPALLFLERRRGALDPALSFATGLLTLLLPVAARNAIVGGEFVLTTAQAGTNFYVGNCSRNPFGVSISLPFVRTVPEHEADDWKREAERRSGRALTRGEVSRFWAREAFAETAEAPPEALRRLARKGAIALNNYEVPDNHSFEYGRTFSPALRSPITFAVAIGLGGAGLLVQARSGPFRPVLLFFLVYLGTLVATVTSDRIRAPLAVPLLVAAGTFFPWLALASRRRRILGLLAAAALLLQALLPAFPSEQVENKRFQARLAHARLLAREGKVDDAEALARSILERYRNDPNVSLLLAEIERHRGMGAGSPAEAAARFAEAERLVREKVLPFAERTADRTLRHKVDLVLGWLALLRGRNEEAVARFTEALAFDPDEADTANTLANALLALGRFDEAERVLERAIRAAPSQWLLWNTLGVARLKRGDRDGAAAAARRVERLGGRPTGPLRALLGSG